jgi:nucleotide-binding universal stress UspA family protein
MNILVGIDGSESSFNALTQTLQRARQTNDTLTVAIIESALSAPPETIEQQVRELLEPASDIDTSIRCLTGTPGAQLTQLAETEDFDRLVVSNTERSPLGKITLESTTEFILLNAQTSVTVVR